MSPPRVEVGCVRLNVFVDICETVRVEDELVGGEEDGTEVALDALGPGRVVAGGNELAAATPRTFVVNLERKGELDTTYIYLAVYMEIDNNISLNL